MRAHPSSPTTVSRWAPCACSTPKARTLDAGQLDALRRLASLVINLLEHESVRIEEATRNSEAWRLQHEELTAMAIAGLDLQVYIDPNYLIQHVNDTYLAYWGGTREDIIGRHIAERVGDDAFRQHHPAPAGPRTGG